MLCHNYDLFGEKFFVAYGMTESNFGDYIGGIFIYLESKFWMKRRLLFSDQILLQGR